SRPSSPRPAASWASSGFSGCCGGRPPPRSATACSPACSSARTCPSASSPPGWPRTTWSAWPYATRTAACWARLPRTTSLITCCPMTGGRREAEMARLSARLGARLGERADLSVPRGATPRMGARYDADAFGRFSEAIARFLGTGKFLAGQTVLVVLWIILNTLGIVNHWDPYPFILLNLAFSTQAAYAAPLILLAQNRQDERDRGQIERDRLVASRTQADAEYLAREVASIRIAVSAMPPADELERTLTRLTTAIERLEARLD